MGNCTLTMQTETFPTMTLTMRIPRLQRMMMMFFTTTLTMNPFLWSLYSIEGNALTSKSQAHSSQTVLTIFSWTSYSPRTLKRTWILTMTPDRRNTSSHYHRLDQDRFSSLGQANKLAQYVADHLQ